MKKLIILYITAIFIASCGSSPADKKLPDSAFVIKPSTAIDTINSVPIDSTKLKEAKVIDRVSKLVKERNDEFTGITFVLPKSKPEYRNLNGLYVYFSKEKNFANNLRLVVQYASNKWLFIESVSFLIDGKPYSYVPLKFERDNNSGGIFEWSDQIIGGSDIELIKALASSKKAKMRLDGQHYFSEKIITSSQIESIKDMYEYFIALGGKFE